MIKIQMPNESIQFFFCRISLFQLEKQRTEGLQFIVTILQKVCQMND
jgi:hypothetical protein